MTSYFIKPEVTSNFILIIAAIIPAVLLMIKVYKSDRLEKESSRLLWSLVKAGILSSLLALVEERILIYFLDSALDSKSLAYNIILNFIIVAGAEESSKYIFMKRKTWRSFEFDSKFDAVVYATFVSLGFALWENISYVLSYGFATAIVRALTAVPGHACFGVFMGIFYGIAKRYDIKGNKSMSGLFRWFSIIFPALLHGTYDFIASMGNEVSGLYFLGFVAVLFIVSYILVNKTSKNDEYIQ